VEIDGELHRFSKTSASKIRFANIEGYTFIEQNPTLFLFFQPVKGFAIMIIFFSPF
jgi:hypothetical protein